MKIEFFSIVPGVYETWPIEPMSTAIPKWVTTARNDYVQNKKSKSTHIFKCHGIGSLYKTGYVVRAWQDIDVSSSDLDLELEVPSNDFMNKTVDVQRADAVAKFIPKRPWSCKSILKINTPWHIIANVKFLMLPIAYSDQHDFESCIGILDPKISTELNIQLYWNSIGQTKRIEAGTPLCHLIPITEKEIKLIVREGSQRDAQWLMKRNYILSMGFNLNINKMKELYKKFWT